MPPSKTKTDSDERQDMRGTRNRKGGLHTRPEKCARCNGTNLHDKSHHVRQITDIEFILKYITTSYIITSVYTDCSHVTESKDIEFPERQWDTTLLR